ncbi:MAG TPA: hypothetical protein VFH31_19350 [Pyrinomonadaceae bacterium]|nr:hypothetical protein [Pyrinomonadaceae bacterium]
MANKNPPPINRGSGSLKPGCELWLFSLSNHNRQHAAIGPMMAGMVVSAVDVMSRVEAHKGH